MRIKSTEQTEIFSWFLATIAYAAMLLALLYLLRIWFLRPSPNQYVFYWFEQNIYVIPGLLTVVSIPAGIFIVVIHRFVVPKNHTEGFAPLIIGIACIGTTFSCIATFPTILGKQTYRDDLHTPTALYRLDSEWKLGVGSASRAIYVVWQCDRSGQICRKLHAERMGPIYLETEFDTAEARLLHNSTDDEIQFVLNGEVKYVYAE